MKAVVLTRYGTPEDLELQDVPVPVPEAGEVLVRVHASAVNDWDWGYIRGRPIVLRLLFGLMRPKTSILGVEIAGTVEAVGADVSRFQKGDRVYGDLSEAGFGGFAEYASVPHEALGPMPDSMSFETAASLPHAAMLAVQGLLDVGGLRGGESVLINGAGGGVGTIGVQIARRMGAVTTGVDSGMKLDLMRSLGFDHVLDYTKTDFTKTDARYDLILDAKTNRRPGAYLQALKPGGRYVTVGGDLARLLQVVAYAPFARLRGRRLHVVALKPNKDLEFVNELYVSGELTTTIDGPYSLAEVPSAIRKFGEAGHLGKLVIRVVDGEDRDEPQE